MKYFNILKAACLGITISVFTGCATIKPQAEDFDPKAEVAMIKTPHTSVLSCLGEMIDASSYNPVFVNVHRLRDETIPEDFEDRGLTGGGMWLAATAITRLNTDKVVAILARFSDEDKLPDNITKIDFRGAFTQFDRLGVTGDANIEAVFRRFGFDLGGSEDYELVTGDFTTSINGRVLNSTAIGVVVLTNSRDGALFWDDGDESVAISLNGRVREGRQNAQRHIIEAATVLHIASYFNIDYKKCLNSDGSYPETVTQKPVSDDVNNITYDDPLMQELCKDGCIQHKVKPGELLTEIISENYQRPYEQVLPYIFAANPSLSDPNQVETGQIIILPRI